MLNYLISVTITAQIQPLQSIIITQIFENPSSTIIIQIIEPQTQFLQRIIRFQRISEIRNTLIANFIIRKIYLNDNLIPHN